MKRWLVRCCNCCSIAMLIAATGMLITAIGGCSMCCGPYDFDYPTFGGKHERVDRSYGRVGSIFSDPNADYGVPADMIMETMPPDGQQRESLDDFGQPMEPLDDLENIEDLTPMPDNNGETTISDRNWRQRPLRRGQTWR